MIRLSPTSGLNLFKECPRCFWLQYNKGIYRPRMIFPSLPGGMDLIFKGYFDQYRGSLPPDIEGKVEGRLTPDLKLINRWRNWRTGPQYQDKKLGAILFGALDDCLIDDQGLYIVLDYKTRGSAPQRGKSKEYYQTQLDSYNLMLDSNGYKVRDFGYLIYYYPKQVLKKGLIEFNIKTVKVATKIARARKIFTEAVELLKGPIPSKDGGCEYCSWLERRAVFE
jgi:hypothetical protein